MIANQDPICRPPSWTVARHRGYALPFRSPHPLDVFAYADGSGTPRRRTADEVLQALTIAQYEGVLTSGVPIFRGADDRRQRDQRHTISTVCGADADPEQLQVLRDSGADHERHEEILRWATPVLHFRARHGATSR